MRFDRRSKVHWVVPAYVLRNLDGLLGIDV